jgi:hypothetical protein
MSAAYLPAPGEKYGPCVEACAHIDCAENRALAAKTCRLCGHPMGAPTYFYGDDEAEPGAIVHSRCLEAQHAKARSP